MYFTNKNIAKELKEIGFNVDTIFYFINNKISIKLKDNNYCLLNGKIIKDDKNILPTYTLSDINNILKYYDKYFTVYYDFSINKWKLNKNIFKIYFLNHTKRKYIDYFKEYIDIEYDSEVDAKSNLLFFLIKSNFININK